MAVNRLGWKGKLVLGLLWINFFSFWIRVYKTTWASDYRESITFIGVLMLGYGLMVTFWIVHNVRIYRRKGARKNVRLLQFEDAEDALKNQIGYRTDPKRTQEIVIDIKKVVRHSAQRRIEPGTSFPREFKISMNLQSIISAIETSSAYTVAISFYGLYPLVTCFVYVVTAIIYYWRRPLRPKPLLETELPFVSIVIPAYCEEDVIERSITGILGLNYPHFELLVINDGSTDKTAEKVRPFLKDPRVRLLNKLVNEGKAMALNDGILCAQGELIMAMDADAAPDPEVLRAMVPHFQSARVAAVAGNPRVRNTTNLLTQLQAIEFSSVIGLMRRAQRIWGRVMCVSGVVGMFRKSALIDIGLFTPSMATEDIDLTWKLQTKFYDVRYEGSALVWMIAPESFDVWWNQRKRWAFGLGQILRRYSHVLWTWKMRRMYPLYIESACSYLWAVTFTFVTAFWVFCYAVGHPPRGGSPIPNFWGMLIYTFCLLQLACGTWLDARYDPEIVHYYLVSIIYPTVYWMMLSLSSCVYTTKGLLRKINVRKPVRWNIKHSYAEKP